MPKLQKFKCDILSNFQTMWSLLFILLHIHCLTFSNCFILVLIIVLESLRLRRHLHRQWESNHCGVKETQASRLLSHQSSPSLTSWEISLQNLVNISLFRHVLFHSWIRIQFICSLWKIQQMMHDDDCSSSSARLLPNLHSNH